MLKGDAFSLGFSFIFLLTARIAFSAECGGENHFQNHHLDLFKWSQSVLSASEALLVGAKRAASAPFAQMSKNLDTADRTFSNDSLVLPDAQIDAEHKKDYRDAEESNSNFYKFAEIPDIFRLSADFSKDFDIYVKSKGLNRAVSMVLIGTTLLKEASVPKFVQTAAPQGYSLKNLDLDPTTGLKASVCVGDSGKKVLYTLAGTFADGRDIYTDWSVGQIQMKSVLTRQLIREAETDLKNGNKVIISGHSLGGALAEYIAAHIYNDLPHDAKGQLIGPYKNGKLELVTFNGLGARPVLNDEGIDDKKQIGLDGIGINTYQDPVNLIGTAHISYSTQLTFKSDLWKARGDAVFNIPTRPDFFIREHLMEAVKEEIDHGGLNHLGMALNPGDMAFKATIGPYIQSVAARQVELTKNATPSDPGKNWPPPLRLELNQLLQRPALDASVEESHSIGDLVNRCSKNPREILGCEYIVSTIHLVTTPADASPPKVLLTKSSPQH